MLISRTCKRISRLGYFLRSFLPHLQRRIAALSHYLFFLHAFFERPLMQPQLGDSGEPTRFICCLNFMSFLFFCVSLPRQYHPPYPLQLERCIRPLPLSRRKHVPVPHGQHFGNVFDCIRK